MNNLFRSLALSISFLSGIFSPLTLLNMLNHWTGAHSYGSYFPTGFTLDARGLLARQRQGTFRACSHGGGGPQVGEVPHLGGVTSLSIQSLFFSWLLSHERWGTSPRRVARSAVPGNPLRWGEFSPCECWRWGGVMFRWAFIHYKTNWKAVRAAKNVKFNAQ